MMHDYIVVDENGARHTYSAGGPQEALDFHYSLDTDGSQPFVVGVYADENRWVGPLR